MKPALPDNIHSILLNSLKDAFVFVDTKHVIQYMNNAAVLKYTNGESLSGKSIFECHNGTSKNIIIEIFEKMKSGLDEEITTDNERHRIYMRAVRDEKGNLLGYYERFEPPVKR